jgi:integrase
MAEHNPSLEARLGREAQWEALAPHGDLTGLAADRPIAKPWPRTKRSRVKHLLNRMTIDDMVGGVGERPRVNEAAPLIRPQVHAGDEPMASIFKPAGKSKYVIFYQDENGRRRKKTGATDKAVTERIARDLENRVALRREGVVDPAAEAYRDHEAVPLPKHIGSWHADLIARGYTTKHAELTSNAVRRLVTLVLGASPSQFDPRRFPVGERNRIAEKLDAAIGRGRLSLLTSRAVQDALARLRDAGVSLQTCNHYRAAVRAFSNWCHKSGRTRDNALRGVTGFNANEDRRHDRRTLGLEELQRLIDDAHNGPEIAGLTGPVRALCYRLAVASGLRYSELASLTPASFDFENGPSVTVEAAYAKNGQTATLFIPVDLASDLAGYVASLATEARVFPLPAGKGARILRRDLALAGIPYRDDSGLVFDFHSLRCQCATLADQAGVTPRVVQKLMRHSSLELTGRYTRPRAVDIEGAAALLPSLKPTSQAPEAAVRTGTDSAALSTATQNATRACALDHNLAEGQEFTASLALSAKPLYVGSTPTGASCDSSGSGTSGRPRRTGLDRRRDETEGSVSPPGSRGADSVPRAITRLTAARPLDLAATAVVGMVFGGFLGATTNAVNGLVSPRYFVTILGWRDVADVWRASIAQGLFEGLLLGVVFSAVFTTACGLITGAACSFGFAARHLLGILGGTYSCWALGGLAGIALACLSPEFYRHTYFGVPAEPGPMIRYAWVGGSIWGAEFGGLLAVLLGLVILRSNWRRQSRAELEPA